MRFGLLISALAVASLTASASPYFYENFDSVSQGYYTVTSGSVAIGNFYLTNGSIDVLGPTHFPGLCVAPATVNCVDTNGMTPGTLVSKPFALPAGNFVLSFVLNGTWRPLAGPNTAEASVTVTDGANTLASQDYVEYYTDTNTWIVPLTLLNASNNVVITFVSAALPPSSVDPNAIATGLVLDTVSVTDAFQTEAAPLPEPMTLPLTGAAFFALGVLRNRKRKK